MAGPRCTMEIKNATATMESWWGQADKRKKMKDMFQYVSVIIKGSTGFKLIVVKNVVS